MLANVVQNSSRSHRTVAFLRTLHYKKKLAALAWGTAAQLSATSEDTQIDYGEEYLEKETLAI